MSSQLMTNNNLRNAMRLAFQTKKYKVGFSIIHSLDTDEFDKYLALIIYSYYVLAPLYWEWLTESVLTHCVLLIPDYSGSSYVLQDYIVGFTAINYFKEMKKDHFDVIIFEGVYGVCTKKYIQELEKIFELSKIIYRPIKFDMYNDLIIKMCEMLNYEDIINFLLRDDVRNPPTSIIDNLVKISSLALKQSKKLKYNSGLNRSITKQKIQNIISGNNNIIPNEHT